MASANKKVTYNSDFKLKVLDYYLRNGGDSKYGLKTKTCALFNINKKTINRLLENPEMVKRAKKVMGRKGIPGTKGTSVKVVKPGSKALGRPPLNKPSSKVASGKQSSSGNSKVSNIGNTSYGTSGTNKQKATGLGSNSSNSNITDKTSKQTHLSPQKDDIGKENESLFDIPDNPDFSILKRPINSSASSNASSIARLLVTGTKEVQNMLLNECEIIFECKVCRNLFRSIVNFLAHKRIYCRDNYIEVKGLFRKDDLCGMTTESSTVVVEPEPPPISSTHKETWATSDNSFSWRSRNRRRRIDNIADTLSRKNKDKVESSPTSASDKGSSYYHQRIGNITAERAKVTRDCSVTLENIVGVSNAVYQTYTPPDTIASSSDYEATHAKIRKQQKGQTAEISKSGKAIPMTTEEVEALEPQKNPEKVSPIKQHICGQCNQQFATAKTLGVHQRSVHNNERTIFPCPICDTKFLSMWAAVKHLHRYHKKNKPQRERLRKVIRKNSYKKILTEAEEGAVQKAAEDMEKEEEEGNEEEEDKSSDSEMPSYNTQTDKSQEEIQENYEKMDIEQEDRDYDDNHDDKEEEISKRREMDTPHHSDKSSPLKGSRSKRGVRWMCNVCFKKFLSRSTCLAHVATHITCNFEPQAVEVPEENEFLDVKSTSNWEQISSVHNKKAASLSGKKLKLSQKKRIERNVGLNPRRKIIGSERHLKCKTPDIKEYKKQTHFEDHEYKCKNYERAAGESDNEKEDLKIPNEGKRKELDDSSNITLSTSFDSGMHTGMKKTYNYESGMNVQTAIIMARKVLAKAKQTAAKANSSSRNPLNTPKKSSYTIKKNVDKGKFVDISNKLNISSGLTRKNETIHSRSGDTSKKVKSTKHFDSKGSESKAGSKQDIDSSFSDSTNRIKGLHFVEQSTSISGKKFTTLIPVARSTNTSFDSNSEKDHEISERSKAIPVISKNLYSSHSEKGGNEKTLSLSPFQDHKPSYASTPQKGGEELISNEEFDNRQGIHSCEQGLLSLLETDTLLVNKDYVREEKIAVEQEVEKMESNTQQIVKYEHFDTGGPSTSTNNDIEPKNRLHTEHSCIQYKSNKLQKGPIDKVGSSISYRSIFKKSLTPELNKSFEGFTDDDASLFKKRLREENSPVKDSISDKYTVHKIPKTDSISQNISHCSKNESSNLVTFENKIKGNGSVKNVFLPIKNVNKNIISNTNDDIELQSHSSSQISIAQNNDSNPIRQAILLSNKTLFGKLSYDFESDYNECTLAEPNTDFESNISSLDSQTERSSFNDLTMNESCTDGDSKDQDVDSSYEDEMFGDFPHDKEEKP